MKFLSFPAFLLCLAVSSTQASANVLTLGLSNQNVTFTGLGGTDTGQGQSRVTWGSCAFDGTNTRCTVSGPFTGLGGGGTYNLVLTYPGNGPSPLTAISSAPGGDLIFFNLSSGSLITNIAENSGPTVTFYDLTGFRFDFSGSTCTGVTNCRVGLEGLTPGSTLTGPIIGTFDVSPMIRAVISAGDYGAFAAIAPATWIEIYGSNLATTRGQVWDGAADFNGNQAPSTLGGTTVTVAGKPAFIDFVSNGQVNAQVPSGLDPGSQPVVVTTAGGPSAQSFVTVNVVEPGLLAPPQFKLKAGQYAVALLPDGVTFILPAGTTNAVRTARAKVGDVITFYGVGFGAVTPDNPAGQINRQLDTLQSVFKISIGGVPATVNYSGLVYGFVGLYQFNVVVPGVAANDAVPVTFTVGTTSAPQTTLLIAVQ